MIAAKVACPRCTAVLKLPTPLAAGQKVRCSHCGNPFAVHVGQASNPAGLIAAGLEACPTPAPAESSFSSLPSPVRQPPGSAAGKGRLLVALGLGTVLLAGAGVGLAVLLLGDKPKPKGREGAKEDPEKTHDGKHGRGAEGRAKGAPFNQAKVNRAVRKAVIYLKDQQGDDGKWALVARDKYARHSGYARHHVALAALPALTLLECGESKKSPAVQRAAKYVRKSGPKITLTYDISLALLFLTRLGDPADRELIKALALRLVAGQTGNGGWGYTCPLLERYEQRQLATVLTQLPRATNADLVRTPAVSKDDPNRKLVGDKPQRGKAEDSTKLVLDTPRRPPPKLVADIDRLSPRLKQVPVLRMKPWPEGEERLAEESDNSNTQFAILGLWAARRQVPLDRTLALIVKRFRTSQLTTGGWGYRYLYLVGVKNNWFGTATMTCAGLLGLAVGHGLAEPDLKRVPVLQDPAVQRALKALSTTIGKRPREEAETGKAIYNLYLLWSVERVGVIYQLKEIGGKDWYAWGAGILLKYQADDGSWYCHGFEGSDPTVDTCLALLFLKRVNLVRDLTNKLTLDESGAGN
jgi:hypothetical protein